MLNCLYPMVYFEFLESYDSVWFNPRLGPWLKPTYSSFLDLETNLLGDIL